MHAEMGRDDREAVDAQRLVAAMDVRKVSSAALARRLDVDDTSVYRWRKGQVPITRLLWLAITHALDLPADWQPDESKRDGDGDAAGDDLDS